MITIWGHLFWTKAGRWPLYTSLEWYGVEIGAKSLLCYASFVTQVILTYLPILF